MLGTLRFGFLRFPIVALLWCLLVIVASVVYTRPPLTRIATEAPRLLGIAPETCTKGEYPSHLRCPLGDDRTALVSWPNHSLTSAEAQVYWVSTQAPNEHHMWFKVTCGIVGECRKM